jgi:hypothetical protein
MVRLRDQFVAMDPRAWNTQWDMTTNVGLGTGDKDTQLGHLMRIAQMQGAALQMPGGQLLLKPKNLDQTASKVVENAGFKNVEDYWTDPTDQPFPQPPPPPEMLKLQADQQARQQEMQFKQQESQQEAMQQEREGQRQAAMQQQEFQGKMQLESMQAMWEKALAEWQAAADYRLEVFKAEMKAENDARNAEIKDKEAKKRDRGS